MIAVAENKKYTIRIPEDLHGQLKQLADQDMRSLHAQILVMLREAAEQRRRAKKRDEGAQS